MCRYLLNLAFALGIATIAAATPAVPAKTFDVTVLQVSAAVQSALSGDASVKNWRFQLPLRVPASSEQPLLEVQDVSAESPGLIVVRLRCVRRECLPFVVYASTGLPGAATTKQRTTQLHVRRRATQKTKERRQRLRQGQQAMLLREEPGMRIWVPVVLLQAGAAGDTVRVRALRGHSIWRATIIEGSMVAAEAMP